MRLYAAVIVALVLFGGVAYAAHPMVTDDAGTLGVWKIQFEVTGEYGQDRESGVTTKTFEVPTYPVLSIGLTDAVDLVCSLSYAVIETEQEGQASSNTGITDAVFEIKWRFFDAGGFSFAIKPAIILPSGDENRGLGNGKTSYGFLLLASYEAHRHAFHLNAGYRRNEYELDSDVEACRRNIWLFSIAARCEVVSGLSVVANLGAERSGDRDCDTPAAFALGGVIYSLSENLDFDCGIKKALTAPETDYSVLAGMTVRM